MAYADTKPALAGGTMTGDLILQSTDAGADENPTLVVYRNSSSPAVNDSTGQILFRGRNNNSQDVE